MQAAVRSSSFELPSVSTWFQNYDWNFQLNVYEEAQFWVNGLDRHLFQTDFAIKCRLFSISWAPCLLITGVAANETKLHWRLKRWLMIAENLNLPHHFPDFLWINICSNMYSYLGRKNEYRRVKQQMAISRSGCASHWVGEWVCSWAGQTMYHHISLKCVYTLFFFKNNFFKNTSLGFFGN